MFFDYFDVLGGHFAVFLLLLTRISGIFMISPFFGSLNIPIMFRAVASLTITMVLLPVIASNNDVDNNMPTVLLFTASMISELFVGWLIGFVAYVVFAAINMGGKIMDMQVGFAIVNVMDPTSGQQGPLIGSFLFNLGVTTLLVTNGHHMLLYALAESCTLIPLTAAAPDPSLAMLIGNFTVGIFATGMKIAMPVTFAILMTNVGLGILARTMPQMNIFVVGIPMQIMIGMASLSMVLPFYIMFLDFMFNTMYANISTALKLVAP